MPLPLRRRPAGPWPEVPLPLRRRPAGPARRPSPAGRRDQQHGLADPLFLVDFAGRHREAERGAVELDLLLQVAAGDPDVIDLGQHDPPSPSRFRRARSAAGSLGPASASARACCDDSRYACLSPAGAVRDERDLAHAPCGRMPGPAAGYRDTETVSGRAGGHGDGRYRHERGARQQHSSSRRAHARHRRRGPDPDRPPPRLARRLLRRAISAASRSRRLWSARASPATRSTT